MSKRPISWSGAKVNTGYQKSSFHEAFKSLVLKLSVVLMNKLCDVEFIAVLFHCKATNGVELFN